MSLERETTREAIKEAGRWLDAEEFVRWIDNRRPDQFMIRLGFAAFTAEDFVDVFGEGKRRETALRAFERWKKGWGYPSGFLTKWEVLTEKDEDRLESALASRTNKGIRSFYLISLSGITQHVSSAIARRDELVAASRAARGRKRSYKRDATHVEVGQALGIDPRRVMEWSRKYGLPFTKKGKKKLFSIEEVEEWAADRERAGIRVATSEDVRNRVPASVARPRFREIRAYLGLTNDRMAELLGVTSVMVSRYVGEKWAGGQPIKSIPASVMERAEALLDTEIARTTRTTKTQRINAEQVLEAMKESGGSIEGAAAILGISFDGLKSVARDLSIELLPKRVPVAPARATLLKVRDKLGLANAFYAELLGVSPPGLQIWFGQGGPWRRLKSIPAAAVEKAEFLLATMKPRIFTKSHLQRITADQVRVAWDKHGTVKGASKELGIAASVFRPMAEHRGVDIPEALVSRVTKRQLEGLLKKHKGVRARMAEELGVSPPYVTMLLKEAGLYTTPPPSAARRGRIGKGEVEQILSAAIKGGVPPHVAAKQAGISRASILKRAAGRYGMLSLYAEAEAKGSHQNPPPRTGGPAFFGRGQIPVEVIRPAWSGDVGYWDVVFTEDGEEGTVSETDLYTTSGERWRAPVRQPGRQAWTNNPCQAHGYAHGHAHNP